MRSILVLVATIGVIAFNWMAATGRLAGVSSADVSAKYPTIITPAGWAFSIWTLIYVGLLAFSIYQLLPANVVRFRPFRSVYIFSCALNCAWLYFWHAEQIAICFVVLIALCLTLLVINYLLREPETFADNWLAKAPFGIYFGWSTAAVLVNLVVMLKFLNVSLTPSTETYLAVGLILVAAILGVLARIRFTNYFYPLAIAWALTAIVVACAVGVIASLIASLSFVMNLKSSEVA